ncbi:unnamed protein product, partial [Ascophyllum nodosum]
ATTWNQKKIWEAEQMDAKRKRDETTANKELQRESDRRRYEQMAGGRDPDPASASLNFMYAPPPGFQQPQEKEVEEDDEEVKKFKALAKMKSDPNFSAAASCSELEKLVGRRKNPGVSLAEQQERFPFLKDAPVEHAYAADVKVNFKPFNNIVRHVKCMRCGEWGHRSGDRECKLINENPNDEERRLREDPMSQISAAGPETSVAGEEPAGEDADAAFLSTLSSKKKRRLLRLLQKMESGEGARSEEEEERKGKRKRSRKKERRSSRSSDKKRKAHEERHALEQSRVREDGGKGGEDKRRRRSHPKEQVVAGGRKGRATPSSEDESSCRDGSDSGRERRERKRSKTSRREDGERRGVKST